MATTSTTTLRVPVELRDRIARLASERDVSMVDIVTDAIDRVSRDQWWASVGEALEGMSDVDRADYRREAELFDQSAGDGLHAD